jgi:hypothetical protein
MYFFGMSHFSVVKYHLTNVITSSNEDDLHEKIPIVMEYVEKALSIFNIAHTYPFARHILFAESFKTSTHHLLRAFD